MGAELKNTIKNSEGPSIWQRGNSWSLAVSHFLILFKDIQIGIVTCLGVGLHGC